MISEDRGHFYALLKVVQLHGNDTEKLAGSTRAVLDVTGLRGND